MESKIDLLLELVYKLNDKVSAIEKKFGDLQKTSPENNRLDLTIGNYHIIEESIIVNCLSNCSLDSDIKLLVNIYGINTPMCPFKLNEKNKFLYWKDNKWNIEDENFISVIATNIKRCYRNVNIASKFPDNLEESVSRHTYLTQITENKYKDTLLKSLKKYMINVEKIPEK